MENFGAFILGRNMFGPVRGPWLDNSWKGWWGENPPYHAPTFVLTHYDRQPVVMEGGTTFYFVTGGIEEALTLARKAAGNRDVKIGGGVSTVRQYLKAGLIDSLHLVSAPIKTATLLIGLLFGLCTLVEAKPAVFAPDSFWYQPIPRDAPLHANSAQFVTEFLRQKKAYYGTVNINTREYSCPIYVVGNDVKTIEVTEWDGQHNGIKDPRLAEQWRAVPMPDYAAPADGTDAEMCVYQPSTDSLWEFWLTRKVEGKWQACWGGRMQNVSKNSGLWEHPYGTTATSLPFIGGQITPDELRRGVIEHVMGIALVDLENWDIISWPATRSDGYNPRKEPNRIPEGLRFRLDPTVDVKALDLSPTGKIIARAAQKYGFVVWDKAGAISLRADNPKAYTQRGQEDPYPRLFSSKPEWSILQGFPWEKLQFLPVDYGKPKGR